mmetsp:Transcript_34948/g.35151  ORF Transcript_34948/g.35151 Transcript_34948/m.35151 type:complete len:164 (-) Transcript_34948:81-572(-)
MILVPGCDGTSIRMRCWTRNNWGRGFNNCPTVKDRRGRTGSSSVQIGLIFSHNEGADVPESWVLLDTCSTDSVAKSPSMVTDVKQCTNDKCLTIFTNGRTQFFEEKGWFNLFSLDVHFNAKSMANILSMKDVANFPGVRVTYDSQKERDIIVHYKEHLYKFKE